MKKQPELDVFLRHDIEEAFKGKIWVYVPVVNKYGCGLGIAVANEPGYSPVPKFNSKDFSIAQNVADRLNAERGFDVDISWEIIASTMQKPLDPQKCIQSKRED